MFWNSKGPQDNAEKCERLSGMQRWHLKWAFSVGFNIGRWACRMWGEEGIPAAAAVLPVCPGLRDFPGHRTWVLELGKSRPTRWVVILRNTRWAGAGPESNSSFIKGRVPERWCMGGLQLKHPVCLLKKKKKSSPYHWFTKADFLIVRLRCVYFKQMIQVVINTNIVWKLAENIGFV